ncbi:MAG: DUF4328 domain-containing protein [Pirellulaceae bacterium]
MSDPLNPYASPQAPADFHSGGPERWAFERPYRSGRGRALFAMTMLGLFVVLYALGLATYLWELLLLGNLPPNAFIDSDSEPWVSLGHSQFAVGIAVVVAFPVTVVAFCMWIYRAHSNLGALRATEIIYSAGWAVGSFFVPILNLFRPFQIMVEIWRGSDPAELPAGSPRPATLVGWWWGLWIVSGVLGRIGDRFARNAHEIPELMTASGLAILDAAVALALAVCAILVIRTIDRNQSLRHELLWKTPPTTAGNWNEQPPS